MKKQLPKFGQYLKKSRKAAKLSQPAVLARLNERFPKIDQTMMSKYENGRAEPGPEVILILIDIYNLDTDEVVGRWLEEKFGFKEVRMKITRHPPDVQIC